MFTEPFVTGEAKVTFVAFWSIDESGLHNGERPRIHFTVVVSLFLWFGSKLIKEKKKDGTRTKAKYKTCLTSTSFVNYSSCMWSMDFWLIRYVSLSDVKNVVFGFSTCLLWIISWIFYIAFLKQVSKNRVVFLCQAHHRNIEPSYIELYNLQLQWNLSKADSHRKQNQKMSTLKRFQYFLT